ncbi:RDD family protein [Chitinilyticum litopenaei]|uniref:RDD family protein n=1 Tax=Chitinilyticum litopenaei TaxID=1121276 RepID=UPI000417756F|nr:RDD family protein [Chitinilyticum litopenaei]
MSQNPYAAPQSDLSISESDQLASRGSRLGAALLDGLVVGMIVFAPLIIWGESQALAWIGSTSEWLLTPLFIMLGLLAFLLPNGYLLAKHGQTVGKRVAKIKIVGLDGKPLPFIKLVFMRYGIMQSLGSLPFIGWAFTLMNVATIFRPDRRCMHDMLAGSKVVKC